MKRTLLSLALFLGLSFALTGLQASLFFLPLPIPCFWFIIYCYYSYSKNRIFSLVCNTLLVIILYQFSSLDPVSVLLVLNVMTLALRSIKERFRVGPLQIVLTTGLGYIIFNLSLTALYFLRSKLIYYPDITGWLGVALATSLLAPALLFCVEYFDNRLNIERVETLQNLRI